MKNPLSENIEKVSADKASVSSQTIAMQSSDQALASERKKKKDDGGTIKPTGPKDDEGGGTIKPTGTNPAPSTPVDIKKILLEKEEEDKELKDKLGRITTTTTEAPGGPNRSDPPVEINKPK